jgi:M6 family metalloprotease-like protein
MKMPRGQKTAAAIVITAVLTGCSLGSVPFLPYGFAPISFDQAAVTAEDYYRPASYEDDYNLMMRTHPTGSQRRVPLRSLGDQKVLVIPVDFTDYRAATLDEGESESRTIIENAFFGRSETTQWESVASFYHQSSYGQLKLSGTVSEWFSSNESVADLTSSGSKTVATERILKAAIQWYKANHDDAASFDQDGDGYLDAVFLVYAAPYVNNDSVFWAFTSFDTGLDGANYVGDPIANAYVWASYHFLNVYRHKGDPHTYIHEFGHLLGLTDYYNTSALPSTFPDFSSGDSIYKRYQYTYGPTGKVDMMDYSIGDHTVLSKMLLNWTRPYVVTGTGTIDLAPFAETGEAIILTNDWNGKAFDEYLAIEFYAPTRLNYVDSERAYGHDSARLMGQFGIKVYHVDARASYHRSVGDAFLGYEDQGPELDLPGDVYASGAYYRQVAHTNTYATTVNEHLIYRLLEKDEAATFLTGAMATNDTLLYEGDSFGIDSFSGFTFNDGTPLPWAFTVASLNRYQATLSFSEIA